MELLEASVEVLDDFSVRVQFDIVDLVKVREKGLRFGVVEEVVEEEGFLELCVAALFPDLAPEEVEAVVGLDVEPVL